jgi:hypothetical protein
MDKRNEAEEDEQEQAIAPRTLWSVCAKFLLVVTMSIAVAGTVVGSYVAARTQSAVTAPRARDDAPVPASADRPELHYLIAPANGWAYSNGSYMRTRTNSTRHGNR